MSFATATVSFIGNWQGPVAWT